MNTAIAQGLKQHFSETAAESNLVEVSVGELRRVIAEFERLARWDDARVQVIHNLHEDLNDLRDQLGRLEEAAAKLLSYADDSDGAQYGTLASSLVRTLLQEALKKAGHSHSEACWEPDSGCDMGRNSRYARVVGDAETEAVRRALELPDSCPIGLDAHPELCSAGTCTRCRKNRKEAKTSEFRSVATNGRVVDEAATSNSMHLPAKRS